MATNMKSLNGYGFDASALGGHDPSYYATSEDIQQVRNEIPTELPNPNALTINGQSYDGSAAVDVTITGGSGANINDTTPSANTTYSSQKIEAVVSELNEANAKQDERLTTLENASGIVTVEPADGDIPKVFIDGEIPTSKTDMLAEMTYISKSKEFHAFLKIKCQGTSSMSYPKKNFTVKLYTDEARSVEMPMMMRNWGVESSKYVLKANYVDHSHARNIVDANLWSGIVASRADYASLPEELRGSPNNGAVDGFPIKVYTNGTYQGIYTWNIGKDAWMWGMDEENANHVLLCSETNTDGTYAENASNFRALWNGVDGTNWSVEVGTNSTAVKDSLNALISCVKDTTDDEFRAQIGNHLDLQSAIDYYIHCYADCGLDSLAKNMLLGTYDLVKWYMGRYDMDSVWGLYWNGSKFVAATYRCPEDYQEQFSLLWERLEALYYNEIKTRYAELRAGALSLPNIVTQFERFMDVIGLDLYAEDLTIYTSIPSGSTNNIKQIRDYVRDRLAYVDEQIAALEAPAEEIPCTGITLDQTTLTFTAAGTQTLTATVTPSDTTDTVLWSSSAPEIASVSGGVVTAKANGSATITAACGAYSATCAVSVSGIGSESDDDGVDYTLDALADVTWTSGQTYDSQTGLVKNQSGEHVTSKFTAQDCLYEVASIDANNTYVALFTFDENDNILWTKEWPGVLSSKVVVQLKPGYRYALKTYNTGTFNEDSLTLTPLDNRETMGAEVTIDLTNLSESDITYDSNRKSFEIGITDRCGGLITASSNTPNYSKVNRFGVQLFVLGNANNQEPKLPTTMQSDHPVYWWLSAWQTNVLLRGYSNVIASAADMAAYLRENNVKIVLNGAAVT